MQTWLTIDKRRKIAGLSRAELCRRAGISERTIYRGLHEKTAPSTRIAEQLEAAFRQHLADAKRAAQ